MLASRLLAVDSRQGQGVRLLMKVSSPASIGNNGDHSRFPNTGSLLSEASMIHTDLSQAGKLSLWEAFTKNKQVP